MKKFFTLIAVAVLAFAAQANVLTVCDGGDTNRYLPIYGLYADTQGTMGQMIYPAEMLTDMVGAEITELQFYAESINFSGATLQLGLAKAEKEDFEDYEAIEGATILGTVVPGAGDTGMTFVFNEPYLYEGGNLMVEVLVTQAGSYSTTYFYGENTPYYYSYYQYTGWSGYTSKYHEAFLPKVTFTYTPGSTPVEPPVDPVTVGAPVFQGYTIDGITGYGVGITPTTEGSEIMYRVLIWDPVTEEWVLRTDWTLYEGTEGEIWFENNGEKVRIEAYAFIGESRSEDVAYEFTVATALDELMSGKTVAGVRYFNMAGQEMQQAEGLTIVVTTYTDGTTSAVKVVK